MEVRIPATVWEDGSGSKAEPQTVRAKLEEHRIQLYDSWVLGVQEHAVTL